MRKAGATLVDVRYPKWLLDAKGEFYTAIRYPEFTAQIADYLATLGPRYPKTLEEMIERANQFNADARRRRAAESRAAGRCSSAKLDSGTLDDYRYTSVRDHALPMVRAVVEGILAAQKLDAIVYPTSPRRPGLIAATGAGAAAGGAASATDIANLTGFPDLIVPAGFHRRRPAGRPVVLRPGVQRAEAARARVQLRAGDARAPAAGAHAGAGRRDDFGAVTTRERKARRVRREIIWLFSGYRGEPAFSSGIRAEKGPKSSLRALRALRSSLREGGPSAPDRRLME